MRIKNSPEREWNNYMVRALELAKKAEAEGDIPVGALIVNIDGKIVAESHNHRELWQDPTAHAEILVLREAAKEEKSWRLRGYTLVVTLEPCVMCAGAMSLSRLDRVVFGCFDPRAGAMGSRYTLHKDEWLNHEIIRVPQVMEQQCQSTLKEFFRSKRAAKL